MLALEWEGREIGEVQVEQPLGQRKYSPGPIRAVTAIDEADAFEVCVDLENNVCHGCLRLGRPAECESGRRGVSERRAGDVNRNTSRIRHAEDGAPYLNIDHRCRG